MVDGGAFMGINEIHDGRDSLLTQRLENLRKVQKREGEDGGGGGRQFQQFFEFSENEENEKEKATKVKKAKNPPSEPPPIAAPPRAIDTEDNKPNHKRDKLAPGVLIDVEA